MGKKIEIEIELRRILQETGASRVLDVGAGDSPYRPVFPAEGYVSIDVEKSGRSLESKAGCQIFDGENIPFLDSSFDLTIATEVLEHAANPEKLVSEMLRVTKIGGHVFITMPFLWGIHEEPYDFQRYTTYGLERLFEKLNAEQIQMDKWTQGPDALLELFQSEIKRSLPEGSRRNLALALSRLTLRIFFKAFPLNLPGLYTRNVALYRKV